MQSDFYYCYFTEVGDFTNVTLSLRKSKMAEEALVETSLAFVVVGDCYEYLPFWGYL